MKAGLKIVNTDLTYDHTALLYELYKDIDLERDIEQYVLPGYGKAVYRKNKKTGKRELKGWYYYPKYNWSLMKYIKWFRKYKVQRNFEEVDTLRK